MNAEVELLREAAKTMRERAAAANPSPWRLKPEGADHLAEHVVFGADRPGGMEKMRHVCCVEYAWEREANAVHIASWHPAVALAVADWLDGEADLHAAIEQAEVPDGWTLRVTSSTLPQALAVARAYLGSES